MSNIPIPVGVTLNAQQISHPIIIYYYYDIPKISKLIPDQGPISGGTKVLVTGLNMHPLKNIKSLDVSKTTFFKFGYIKVKGSFKLTGAATVSPLVTAPGKALIQVNLII